MRGRKGLCHKGVCVVIVETIVGLLLCCGVDIVQCFQSFVLHHLVIHSSATPTKLPQKENFALFPCTNSKNMGHASVKISPNF